jgi:hypothetical protein
MDAQKTLEVVKKYQDIFQLYLDAEPIDAPYDFIINEEDRERHFDHCASMLIRMEKILKEEPHRLGKMFRWLGFIQGVLWTHGVLCLTELKNDNRPDNPNDSEINE